MDDILEEYGGTIFTATCGISVLALFFFLIDKNGILSDFIQFYATSICG